MNKMAAPIGQHGNYLFWLQLLNCLSDFLTFFTDGLRKRSSLCSDQKIDATVPFKVVEEVLE